MASRENAKLILSVEEIAIRLVERGRKVVALLIGVPASGKSTLARQLLGHAGFVHLNADSIRKEVNGDESNHDRDNLVWMKFQERYEAALQSSEPVLVDNMNHTRATRSNLIRAARKAGYAVKLVYLDVPLAVCIERNRNRGKDIPDFTIMEKHVALRVNGKPLPDEDAIWIAPTAEPEQYEVTQVAPADSENAFDIVGDVHGCADELEELIEVLGYKLNMETRLQIRPQGRKLAFVGDLVDRGPDSARVLDMVMALHKQGAIVVLGNHCYKVMRYLQGHQVRISKEVERTIEQIKARGIEFTQAVLLFLKEVQFIFETGDLIIVHAAYKQLARGEKANSLALYGETSGEKDANGYPVRLDSWETGYMGGKTIVHGHVPVSEPKLRNVYNGGRIVNVDTGCCFGGKLTALRYPEMEFISVPARAQYSELFNSYEDAQPEGAYSMQQTQTPAKAPVTWTGAYGVGVGLPLLSQFDEMEEAGWIWSKRVKTADGFTYRLFNYSKGCAYDRVWNEVTTVSRGLIVCEETGEVIAASMPKFYNLGETVIPGVVAGVKEGDFEALVKMDGSCGIGYRLDGRYRWATRGSFTSSQAAVAQTMWDAKYAQFNELLCGEWNHLTLVTEIIHPETRVVCRYDFEDLVLIAARNRFTGEDLSYAELTAIGERLGMRVVERIDGADVEALVRRAETLNDNEEGFVFRWPCGYRLKVKGNEYKRLHRLLSGITPRELAYAWHDTTIVEMLRMMPEEFREETEQLMRSLDANTVELARQTDEVYRGAGEVADQKAFATWVKTQDARLTGFLFARRQQEQVQGAASICRAALGNLFFAQHLTSMLREMAVNTGGESELAGELDLYLEAVGSYLWDRTRTQEDCGKAKALGSSLPKALRGTFDGAVNNLQPQIMVEKMREFVHRSSVGSPELAGVDVDAIFADAPAASAPEGLHNQWVFAQPMLLRPFLDRWRYCGQRETAIAGARKLLADAIRSGVAEEFLDGIGRAVERHAGKVAFNKAVIARGLKALQEQLSVIWHAMPRGSVQQMADAASRDAWMKALLNEAWAGQRAQVRDLYVASDPEMKSFAKLEEL